MPSRILLVNTNRCTTPDPVFPLGLVHLNAALRRAGHECLWLDALADEGEFESRVKSFRPDYVGLSLRNVDDVLIRKQQTFFTELGPLIEGLRRVSPSPVILGGSGFSIFPRELFEMAGVDFGIVGEGETSLVALVAALEQGADFSKIPGLVFRKEGRTTLNPPSPDLTNRDLCSEDWPPTVVSHYLKSSGTLNLQTQRGCAFRCCYCTYPVIEGRKHRRRSGDVIAAEFERAQRLGAKYLFIVDSVFNSSPAHVTDICEGILRAKIDLPWGCFLRPQGLTPKLVRLMKRAGLAHIEFGSDSFSDSVLEAYQKGFTFGEILSSSELARQEGIDFCHYVIAGGPGETHATLSQGFENSRWLSDAVVMAVVGMRIYPGTELFARTIAEGQISKSANLLAPAYYLAPGLQREEVFQQLKAFARRSPNWIVGDPDPSYANLVARLRQRGVVGPLWSYFSMIQHIRPTELAGESGQGRTANPRL